MSTPLDRTVPVAAPTPVAERALAPDLARGMMLRPFAYGIGQLHARRTAAGSSERDVHGLLRARHGRLLAFGLVHAALFRQGDIPGPYGLLGLCLVPPAGLGRRHRAAPPTSACSSCPSASGRRSCLRRSRSRADVRGSYRRERAAAGGT